MSLLGIDLGGTKLAVASFTEDGKIISKEKIALEGLQGDQIGSLITNRISAFIGNSATEGDPVRAIGICVPGISYQQKGTVWAPNIPGWSDYPLLQKVKTVTSAIPVTIDSDRACYILGELWQGNAKGSKDAIFLAVGTGIGAGILVNGTILRGSHDIAGAIGWMALSTPYKSLYENCGCFEYHCSGEGIANIARAFLQDAKDYEGKLKNKNPQELTSYDVFAAFETKDILAAAVIQQCIVFWGMAVANLISLFNPEKIILGGGVFGPAIPLIPEIKKEAMKWAQPISVHQYSLEASSLGGDAGIYGAGLLALKNINPSGHSIIQYV